MLSFPPAVRIWLALAPADLRKGFDALAELVRQHLRDDPLSGHVFVFRNRRGDRIKLLYWDSDGFVIVYKRLEAGVFRFPVAAEGQASVSVRAAELAMLLDGVDWQNATDRCGPRTGSHLRHRRCRGARRATPGGAGLAHPPKGKTNRFEQGHGNTPAGRFSRRSSQRKLGAGKGLQLDCRCRGQKEAAAWYPRRLNQR